MSDAPPAAPANGHDSSPAGPGASASRPARLPRWTRQEILVLIEGKRVVESRGRGRGPSRAGLVGPAEPKWASVSTYCCRHGVNRGPVQCRKRWSNLAGDFKKIKEWESGRGTKESFWVMRNDARREKRLPGFFDREVYDILDGAAAAVEREEEEAEGAAGAGDGEEEEAVFDSGRTAAEDGLFSDFEGEEEDAVAAAAGEEEEETTPWTAAAKAVRPISEKKLEISQNEHSDSGMHKGKQSAENPDKAPSSSQEGHKRRRTSQDRHADADTDLQNQLIQVLDRNSRMLTAQLEAQNVNNQLDREQRKNQTDGLLGVLNKVADALARIADKL